MNVITDFLFRLQKIDVDIKFEKQEGSVLITRRFTRVTLRFRNSNGTYTVTMNTIRHDRMQNDGLFIAFLNDLLSLHIINFTNFEKTLNHENTLSDYSTPIAHRLRQEQGR